MSGLLAGRRILILGVANARSIAWATAQAAHREGARLLLTYQERMKDSVLELAKGLPGTEAVPCEVTDDASLASLAMEASRALGGLDGVVHAIAFAPVADLARPFVETSRDGYRIAMDVSAFSLPAVLKHVRPLFGAVSDGPSSGDAGASVVAYTYLGAERAIPGYNVMGAAKAALEAGIRYLAADLGPAKVRVNGISAGPINTLSARGVSGFSGILDIVKARAPLKRNVEAAEVADATVFLLSDLARGITGEILHVDAGYHCMGL